MLFAFYVEGGGGRDKGNSWYADAFLVILRKGSIQLATWAHLELTLNYKEVRDDLGRLIRLFASSDAFVVPVIINQTWIIDGETLAWIVGPLSPVEVNLQPTNRNRNIPQISFNIDSCA